MRERNVVGYLNDDGTATVTGSHLPTDQAAAACARIEDLAKAAKRAGHPGRVGHLLADLDVLVKRDGPIVDTPQGPRANPAAVEARQQWIVSARVLAALCLPSGEEGDTQPSARPQRRGGARGVYGIRAVP